MESTNTSQEGMDPDILSIKISKEAKDWDRMSEKVIKFLKKTKNHRLEKR